MLTSAHDMNIDQEPSALKNVGMGEESREQGSIHDMCLDEVDTYDTQTQEELKVTFVPPLFLQRRVWILDTLRRERVTSIVDIGCGEGQLLNALSQPAPWLAPPSKDCWPPTASIQFKQSYPSTDPDDIPNLHPMYIAGLDILLEDLQFAVENVKPPAGLNGLEGDNGQSQLVTPHSHTPTTPSYRHLYPLRWEPLRAEVWHGSVDVVNETFVGVECIVSSEVIEHLTEATFPFYAPMILGVYHPRLLLITTPSYTFNARFTPPSETPCDDVTAPRSNGYPDPTGRTTRVFRHEDHKFEWTVQEFTDYSNDIAQEWGYRVELGTIGRPVEEDPWGRNEALGGATQVACFVRADGVSTEEREARGRQLVKKLWDQRIGSSATEGSAYNQGHSLIITQMHPAHPSSKQPESLSEIGRAVRGKMVEYREAFVQLEELWFDPEVAIRCGGWIEWLIWGIQVEDGLALKKEKGDERKRGNWLVELVGGIGRMRKEEGCETGGILEKDMERLRVNEGEADRSVDFIPKDWIPGEEGSCYGEESSEDRDWESTAAEGDVSWNGSEIDEDPDVDGWGDETTHPWEMSKHLGDGWNSWKDNIGPICFSGKKDDHDIGQVAVSSSANSTTGWDGDQSEDTS